MLIDWFTVTAQVLNFLILVWLLKRFLYRPVLDAIDKRDHQIIDRIQTAEKREQEAASQRAEYEKRSAELANNREALLGQAKADAEEEKQRLMAENRAEFEALRVRQRENFLKQQASVRSDLVNRTQREVFAIARRALSELAGSSLEERMAEIFVRRLKSLDDETRGSLAALVTESKAPVTVRSAFELPAPSRAMIQSAVSEVLSEAVPIQFETVPEILSGIELVTDGHKVSWSLSEYLSNLERNVGELLEQSHAGTVESDA